MTKHQYDKLLMTSKADELEGIIRVARFDIDITENDYAELLERKNTTLEYLRAIERAGDE